VRDEVLAAIRARNARARQSSDPGPVLDPDALVEVAALLALVTGPAADPGRAPDLEAMHAAGWLYWLRVPGLPADEAYGELRLAAAALAPVFVAAPETVPDLLRGWYEESGLSAADREPGGGRDDPDMCLDQAGILYQWYERSGDAEALPVAARLCRTALAAMPGNHPRRESCLSNLGLVLQDLAELGDSAAASEAADLALAAVAAVPEGHPVRAGYLSRLSAAYRALFDSTGSLDALGQAAAAGRSSVATASEGDPGWTAYASDLGDTLVAFFGETGDLDALREAVALLRTAVAAEPGDGHDQVRSLSSFGSALQTLGKHTGDGEALREAVDIGRAALAAAPGDHPQYSVLLSNLGNYLSSWFAHTGDLDALHEAAAVGRAAVAAAGGNATDWSNLSVTLQTLFEHTGDVDTLREAVTLAREAADETPSGHPLRAVFLANLGISLRTLFEETADLDALREAARAHRESAAATPGGHSARAGRLSNLGNTLRVLSDRTEDLSLLREAVTAGREAVAAVPEGDPGQASYAANLANALYALGCETGEADAFRDAVTLGQAAVAATQDGHPSLPNYLSTLAACLTELARRTEDPQLLSEAVTAGREAVAAAHEGHSGLAFYQVSLGLALLGSARQTSNREELTQARAVLAEAARSPAAAVSTRILAGRHQSEADTEAEEHRSALAAIEGVISLLPLAAPSELRRADREYQLGNLQGVAGRAAAAALAAGQPERAVELLEQARGLLLAEAIDARSEQRRLQALAPDLAGRFGRLRERLASLQAAPLHEASILDQAAASQPAGGGRAPDRNGQRLADQRRKAAAQWEALLAAIRARPGLADFLAPPAISDLSRQASDGPVIIVTPDVNRCDALILSPGPGRPVLHVPLPGLTPDSVTEQANRFLAACSAALGTSPAGRRRAQSDLREILGWLWDTTADPVLTALGHSSLPEPDQVWPRVWWCPVGVMAYLPLHAAGHHDDTASGAARPRTVLDRVVSSYTSTVRALGYARQETPSRTTSNQALIVAMPDTPGAAALPAAEHEAVRLASLLPGATVILGRNATRDAVTAALPLHSVAHFACHGISDQDDPAGSRLLLHDHASRPLDVTAISRLHLKADLAFLSACSTTQTSPRLVDEAVHITAAFQLAGYGNVVGTLWPVYEHAAALIADDVYTDLTGDGAQPPETRRTALALHHAVRRLRADHPDDPAVWAAHIHAGI
jgi:hypothetical protein